MLELLPSNNDSSGVTRTPTGEIVSPQPTSIPPSTPESKPTSPPSTTPETKSEAKTDAKASDKSLISEKGEEPKGAPEKYEDFKVPEDYTLDPEVAKDVGAVFKRLDINQSGAQELMDLYVKYTKESHEQPYNTYLEMRQKWRDEVSAHPEIGGAKLKATQVSIAKLIDSFGNSELQEAFRNAMTYTGAGDHPAIVEGLAIVAKRLTEGAAVRGNGPVEVSRDGKTASVGGPEKPTAAQAIYPNLVSTQRG